jgi:hypothetical protein
MTLLLDANDSASRSRREPPTSAGPDLGVIEDARRRQRARRIRVAVCAALFLAIAGLTASLLHAGGSRASQHTARLPAGAAGRRHEATFGVRLSPALDGGEYGWCVGVEEAGYTGTVGGGCSMMPVASAPVAWRLSGASVRTHRQWTVLVTTPDVAAVLVNGSRRVPTVALPGLPYGLRAVRVVAPLDVRALGHARHGFASLREPRLVALDRSGRPLLQPSIAIGASGGVMRPVGAGSSGSAPCSLRAGGVPGLAAQWSHVASAIRPFAGALVGRAFFSCVDTEFYLRHWPLDAAILLDAAHPGSRPAAIPGFVALAGDPGYYGASPDFKGDLTAVRSGDAWLVVAGGSGLAQRVELLRHLTPVVKLPRA